MKNYRTLLIASFLLILCVLQKEARYKTIRSGGVEKMHNFPSENLSNSTFADKNIKVSGREANALQNTQLFEFASADSTSKTTSARLLNQNLLNISSGGKILGFN
ncbi:hypothetical protein [Dyadobacter pollutisoli]|uniref:Uncharacterized protein n=1 Tax=Dyadobacter pollutisoli TaxID=2910158 RepID=A0A9E8N980_9BACT|nr:hypothetical protein [Dyadobacter pollutisoli]WAC11083.1 hypothetical protein ON006_25530 [Dyadobacter pollutisoli]